MSNWLTVLLIERGRLSDCYNVEPQWFLIYFDDVGFHALYCFMEIICVTHSGINSVYTVMAVQYIESVCVCLHICFVRVSWGSILKCSVLLCPVTLNVVANVVYDLLSKCTSEMYDLLSFLSL